MLEGNGLDDAWGLRRRIEMPVMQLRAEEKKAMMEYLASLLLLLAATWNDWAWMEVEKTGLEFQEPVGIPVCSRSTHRSKAATHWHWFMQCCKHSDVNQPFPLSWMSSKANLLLTFFSVYNYKASPLISSLSNVWQWAAMKWTCNLGMECHWKESEDDRD